jgi:Aspartyl protease
MPLYDGELFVPPAPIARVLVRHPERDQSVGDVPMLIDSGADATLLPRSVATSLRLEGTGERYQLAGFDGTISESEAVLACLVFLRTNFRGRYLLVDAEVGVLGRDILNHVRLLLDGPALRWEERTFAQ